MQNTSYQQSSHDTRPQHTEIKAISIPASRHRLPDERRSITHKFSIAGHEGYVTVGLYEDGRPGELFIVLSKQGSTLRGLLNAVGVLTSIALQSGIPVSALAEKFADTDFEPSGYSANADIGYAKSVLDYIFRWLNARFPEAANA